MRKLDGKSGKSWYIFENYIFIILTLQYFSLLRVVLQLDKIIETQKGIKITRYALLHIYHYSFIIKATILLLKRFLNQRYKSSLTQG